MESNEPKPKGRPPIYSEKLHPISVTLDPESKVRAEALGGGSISAGIRIALSLAQCPTPVEQTIQDAMHPGSSPALAEQNASMAMEVTLEDKLKELKRLSEAGLISQEIYLERQRLVLDGER